MNIYIFTLISARIERKPQFIGLISKLYTNNLDFSNKDDLEFFHFIIKQKYKNKL